MVLPPLLIPLVVLYDGRALRSRCNLLQPAPIGLHYVSDFATVGFMTTCPRCSRALERSLCRPSNVLVPSSLSSLILSSSTSCY
ncbi:hypothetical protein F4782DRAFT_508355 [Xylaria castorea]|nr:hypothetical protein F4782DRAFT_508355 [Xylaria castorea]